MGPLKNEPQKPKEGKLLFIDACVRGDESRTRGIAVPIVAALSTRYEVEKIDLTSMDISPLTPSSYAERGKGNTPEWAEKAARKIADADRIIIAAPFWDMSFPAVLKAFFEQVSLFGITFEDNGKKCVGLCKCKKVLYVTTRGMDIPTGDPREQGTPYIKALSYLWGLGEVETIAAWNMDYISPEKIEEKISGCVIEGIRLAKTF